MRKALSCIAMAAWLTMPITLPLLTGGCGVFTGSRQAVAHKTLKSIQISVDALMKTYGTAVVTGQVSPEKQDAIDFKHAQYRAAFRSAVTLARSDLSTAPPEDLQQLANELQLLISSL